jgi:hypothetical protein
MNFNLNYSPPPSLAKISHNDKILLIGSCFAENIGEKLLANKFQALINPNGILFNPASIATAIESYIKNHQEVKIVNNNGLNCSLEHHGSFSRGTEQELTSTVLNARRNAHQFLKEAKFLIITFGSAYVYRHINANHIVANCHKLPQNDFIKDLLRVDDIISIYSKLINDLRDFNPSLKIIFTVSPVKYLRDGLINNNLSKAILLQAVHNKVSATSNLQSTLLNYFPAYELVNDDLRDYRFYKEDMAHPNEQAINYVWEKFSETYFSSETKQLNQKIKEITQAAQHRPLNENSEKHNEFKTATLKKCLELEGAYPFLNFSQEKEVFMPNSPLNQ